VQLEGIIMKRLLCLATASLFFVLAFQEPVRAVTISVNPTSHDFGTVTVGQTVEFDLTGHITLNPGWIAINWLPEFSGGTMTDLSVNGGGGCGNQLDCTFAIRWSPTTPGSYFIFVGLSAMIISLSDPSGVYSSDSTQITGVAVPAVSGDAFVCDRPWHNRPARLAQEAKDACSDQTLAAEHGAS
jgi:hypothetical protein